MPSLASERSRCRGSAACSASASWGLGGSACLWYRRRMWCRFPKRGNGAVGRFESDQFRMARRRTEPAGHVELPRSSNFLMRAPRSTPTIYAKSALNFAQSDVLGKVSSELQTLLAPSLFGRRHSAGHDRVLAPSSKTRANGRGKCQRRCSCANRAKFHAEVVWPTTCLV